MTFKKIASVVLILSLVFCTNAFYGTAQEETPGVSEASLNKLGLIDADDTVTASDALLALQGAVGKVSLDSSQKSAADVDCSDTVTAADALQVLQFSVNKINGFAFAGLSGRTITISTMNINKYTSSAQQSIYNAKISELEKKYGVKINFVSANADEVKDSVKSGKNLYDISEMYLVDGRNTVRSGQLRDISGSVFYDNELFDSGMTGSFTLGNGVYGVATDAMSANAHGLMMNADLLKQYAPVAFSKLGEQFESKTWTWEAFRELCAEYASNAPAEKSCIVSNTNIIGQVIVSNCGYEVKFNDDKKGAVCSICSDDGIEAMSYVRSLRTDGYWKYISDIDSMYNTFKDGNAAIFAYYLDAASWSKYYDFGLTAMPFPIGTKSDDYAMSCFTGLAYCVPASSKATANAEMLILNELAAINDELEEAFITSSRNMGYNELGQNVFSWAAKNTTADFSSGPFTGAVGTPVDSSVLSNSKTPETVLPGIRNLVQSEVDAYYGQFYVKD